MISHLQELLFPYLKFEKLDGKKNIIKKVDEWSKIKGDNKADLKNNYNINIPSNETKSSQTNNQENCVEQSFLNKNKNNVTQIISKEDEMFTHYHNLLKKNLNLFLLLNIKLL